MDFSDIRLDLARQGGICRLSDSGIKWAVPNVTGTTTFKLDNIDHGVWSRAALGYQIRVITRDGKVAQLDGFVEDDHEPIAKYFKRNGIALDAPELSVKGYNWGKADFGEAELTFKVGNKPSFEIPYSGIANVNISGKNEIAVELASQLAGAKEEKNKGKKELRTQNVSKNVDQLVEIRFYVPGSTKPAKAEKGSDDEDEPMEEDEKEEENGTDLFYETLMKKADVANVLGDKVTSFREILHLTPRGRFDIDLFRDDFRLRGKTYDYKIRYDSIKKFMLLPKPDELHTMITIGIDPPIRQGQTRYPFIVMQFKNDDEVPADFKISDEIQAEEQYKGKLQINYDMSLSACLASVFKDLSGKKVIAPSREFVSHHQHSGVKCSIKTNEGHLFCLDRSLMFVPKPATYISFENIGSITLSRVGTAVSAGRTFDLIVTLKDGTDHQFSTINREEQAPLCDFFKQKNIRVKNNMDDGEAAVGMGGARDRSVLDTLEQFGDDTDESDATASDGNSDEEASDASDSDDDDDEGDAPDDDDDGSDDDAGDGSDAAESRPKKKVRTN